ncbi:MAG: endonuclease/exonuclease/phosphatase family protein [Planctomycetota bacterium]|jgi:endonuclease/exonuclease/phosphatase family metal-dependent hydrolase|nr:endonuclease/exonuclease/phosphatase family protein [Planctomycetota bacterium]
MLSRILAGTSVVVFAVLSLAELVWTARDPGNRFDAPIESTSVESWLAPDTSVGGPEMKVMTFNLKIDLPLVPGPEWSQRRARALQVIRKADPDILGLQEDLYHQLEDVRKGLPSHDFVGEGSYGGVMGEFCSIFYRRSRFQKIDSGSYWLSERPDCRGSTSWGNSFPRVVTWLHLRDLAGEPYEFFVYNLHLPDQNSLARRRCAVRVRGTLLNRLRQGYPVLAIGDLNVAPDGVAYRILCKEPIQDAFDLSPDPLDQGTFHDWTGQPVLGRIDHILGGGISRVGICQVVVNPSGDRAHVSDHYPVVAHLKLAAWKYSKEETGSSD